jgi:hypothetical protein
MSGRARGFVDQSLAVTTPQLGFKQGWLPPGFSTAFADRIGPIGLGE